MLSCSSEHQPRHSDPSTDAVPQRSSHFSPELVSALRDSYSGLRLVTQNWIQTGLHDIEEAHSVLRTPALSGLPLERESTALASVSADRVAKLLRALHVLNHLLEASHNRYSSCDDYDRHVRDPLGHLKILATDRVVASCGSVCQIEAGPSRDISLRTLFLTHAAEIDNLTREFK